jgi:DNA-binding CsgD family transcriptional regulator
LIEPEGPVPARVTSTGRRVALVARGRARYTTHPWQLAATLMLSLVVASSVAWVIEQRVTELLLADVLARASDQVELGLVPRLTLADFEPPYTHDKLDALDTKLDSTVVWAREPGSGVIRFNLFARDGTLLYSDLASLRGQVVSPLSDPLLGAALAGSASAEVTTLTRQENADLEPRYGSALEAYVPCILDGRVAGAYELYTEPGPLQRVRWSVWTSVGLGFMVLVGGMAALWRRPVSAAVAVQAHELVGSTGPPPGIGTGLVRLNPSGDSAGVGGSPPSANGGMAAPVNPASETWLSRRETEVLRLLATNRTYRDIAAELSVSEETIRSHVKSILHKLGQPDRARAVAAAVRAGILRT